MDNDNEILSRLFAIPDKEWVSIVDKLTSYVYFKLKGKTLYGAHTESNLGVEPVSYYVDSAIEKLFSLEWKWKYDKYTIQEQLQVIVGSMLSSNVEKYKANKFELSFHDNDKLAILAEKEDTEEFNADYELFREALTECSKDDDDLQLYVMAFDECNSFDEMAELLEFDKKKLYALQKKLTRRITSYLESKKEIMR